MKCSDEGMLLLVGGNFSFMKITLVEWMSGVETRKDEITLAEDLCK
jgi:hypothetical protein